MKPNSIHQQNIQGQLWSLLLVITLLLLTSSGSLLEVQASDLTPPNQATFTTQIITDGGSASLELMGPTSANVGDEVTFVLMGRNVNDLAGFQAVMSFDPAGLAFINASLAGEFSQSGNSVVTVGPIQVDGSVLLGSAICPVEGCKTSPVAQATLQSPRLTGDIPLGSFTFIVRSPGALAIQISNTQLVDASGGILFASEPVSQAATASMLSPLAMDITGNQVINDSDAHHIIDGLIHQFETGQCSSTDYAGYDMDQSGCIGIADVQMILSHWGETTSGIALDASKSGELQADFVLTVNSDGDGSDTTPGNGICADAGGECTLRAAIMEANAHAGREIINFDILGPGGACPAVVTIASATTLEIDDAFKTSGNFGVTIDGYTQCGASANNSATVAGNAVIKIQIKGPQNELTNGLYLNSGNNLIKGLALYDWANQIFINDGWAVNNIIQGNFIGTNAALTYLNRWGNPNDADGVRINDGGGTYNIIGGTNPADRNIISGAFQDGVGIRSANAHHNVIIGNYIGLKQDGSSSLANGSDGVDVGRNATNNQIGGLNPGERNVISGNGNDGVEFAHQAGTNNNQVIGNFIGVNAAGNAEKRNGQKGVTIEDFVNNIVIDHNVIAGNGTTGILLEATHGNQVTNNFIGVSPQGIGPGAVVPDPITFPSANLTTLPNGLKNDRPLEIFEMSGIYVVAGSQDNLIQHNIIANHTLYGIFIDADQGWSPGATCAAYFNTISENRIYQNGNFGIFFRSDSCGSDPTIFYPNQHIQPPVLMNTSTSTISGTACLNCTVELFLSDKTVTGGIEPAGEGKLLVGTGQANGSGAFAIAVTGLVVGDIVTGTATDALGNTSEFAVNVPVGTGGPAQFFIYLPIILK